MIRAKEVIIRRRRRNGKRSMRRVLRCLRLLNLFAYRAILLLTRKGPDISGVNRARRRARSTRLISGRPGILIPVGRIVMD